MALRCWRDTLNKARPAVVVCQMHPVRRICRARRRAPGGPVDDSDGGGRNAGQSEAILGPSLSDHTRTKAPVIDQLLPLRFVLEPLDGGTLMQIEAQSLLYIL